MFYATIATYIVARYALGIWGVGRPCSPAEGWLALLREYALLWLCAAGMYVGVGVAQGVWLDLSWATTVAFYYWSLLTLLHAGLWQHIQERACAIGAEVSLSATQQTTYELHSLRGTGMGCVISTLYLLIFLRHAVQPPLNWIFYYLALITPLGGLLSAHFAAWAYGAYGMYTLVVASVLARASLLRREQQGA